MLRRSFFNPTDDRFKVGVPLLGKMRAVPTLRLSTMALFINRTALLADDQSPVRQAFYEILRRSHCTVVGEVTNTDDLLDRCERLRPDLVIMDVSLPGSYEPLVAIERLRLRQPEITVLAVGAMSQDALMMEALTKGAADFILKPIQARSVELCLQRHVG